MTVESVVRRDRNRLIALNSRSAKKARGWLNRVLRHRAGELRFPQMRSFSSPRG